MNRKTLDDCLAAQAKSAGLGMKDPLAFIMADKGILTQDEFDSKKAELLKLQEDYDSQALILSEPKRREREEDIQKRRSELDAFVQEIWGPSGRVARRNEELTRPIVDKIREVLNGIGRDEGFSIIFDATDGNVVYADDAFDLTDRVIAALNEQR